MAEIRGEAETFSVDHFEPWATRLILDNGEPWRLEEFQREFLEDLFRGERENWLIVPEGGQADGLASSLSSSKSGAGEPSSTTCVSSR